MPGCRLFPLTVEPFVTHRTLDHLLGLRLTAVTEIGIVWVILTFLVDSLLVHGNSFIVPVSRQLIKCDHILSWLNWSVVGSTPLQRAVAQAIE